MIQGSFYKENLNEKYFCYILKGNNFQASRFYIYEMCLFHVHLYSHSEQLVGLIRLSRESNRRGDERQQGGSLFIMDQRGWTDFKR